MNLLLAIYIIHNYPLISNNNGDKRQDMNSKNQTRQLFQHFNKLIMLIIIIAISNYYGPGPDSLSHNYKALFELTSQKHLWPRKWLCESLGESVNFKVELLFFIRFIGRSRNDDGALLWVTVVCLLFCPNCSGKKFNKWITQSDVLGSMTLIRWCVDKSSSLPATHIHSFYVIHILVFHQYPWILMS